MSFEKKKNLHRLLKPQTIAVIGATDKKGRVGHALMENLIRGGFKGKVYPVNPFRQKVFQLQSYPTIIDVPERVDLALVATPATTVPQIINQCGQAHAAGVIIISSGFKGSGPDGQKLYQKLKQIVDKYPTRVIGPNCLGVVRPDINLNATFAFQKAKKGRVAFISQSGALGASILDWAVKENIGFSYFFSIGEMIDVNFTYLINYLNQDSRTQSVILYVETINDPQGFIQAARKFSLNKPIVILKAGKTKEGARAALSHTGSLVGDNLIFEAVLKRVGALRVETMEELFDCTRTLATQPLPRGGRLAIVTNAGGAAVIATDILVTKGGQLAQISPPIQKKLKKLLPPAANVHNPVDVLGDADSHRYHLAVSECLKDSGVDGVLVILAPQAMTEPLRVARNLASLPNPYQKPILASWMGGDEVVKGIKFLQQANIPAYQYPERAVETFINLYQYSLNQELLRQKIPVATKKFKPQAKKARELIKKITSQKRHIFTEEEAKELLFYYEIPSPKSILARSRTEAVRAAKKIGFPVAMKITAPGLLHKTEYQGVKLDVSSENQVRLIFGELLENYLSKSKKTKPHGVLVEKMIEKKYELFLGSKKDKLFGPVILFGRGGLAVEIIKDLSADLPPLNLPLAERLIERTKIYQLLKGYRSIKPINLNNLQSIIYKFSCLVTDLPEIKIIEVNPLAADEEGILALDAKIILERSGLQRNTPIT